MHEAIEHEGHNGETSGPPVGGRRRREPLGSVYHVQTVVAQRQSPEADADRARRILGSLIGRSFTKADQGGAT